MIVYLVTQKLISEFSNADNEWQKSILPLYANN